MCENGEFGSCGGVGGEGGPWNFCRFHLALCCGQPCAPSWVFIALAQALTPHCTLPAPCGTPGTAASGTQPLGLALIRAAH